jgi:hypothetical protein
LNLFPRRGVVVLDRYPSTSARSYELGIDCLELKVLRGIVLW